MDFKYFCQLYISHFALSAIIYPVEKVKTRDMLMDACNDYENDSHKLLQYKIFILP